MWCGFVLKHPLFLIGSGKPDKWLKTCKLYQIVPLDVLNFSSNKPLLANIQKEAFSLDNTELELTKHDIAFSTPGSLTNLMIVHSNIHRAIPALVLTDVEKCVDNDPLYVLLNRFGAMPIQHRPRVGFALSSFL